MLHQKCLWHIYLIKWLVVRPIVTLCILQYAGGTHMDAVAGQMLVNGLRHFLTPLDGQQSQRPAVGHIKATGARFKKACFSWVKGPLSD